MAFYENMQKVAKTLLKQFGNEFILRKPGGEPAYNPKTKRTEESYKDYFGVCVMKTYSDEAMGALGNIIESGDVAFVCQMNDEKVVPQADKDKLVFNNISYNIIRVQTSNPNGFRTLVHTLQCRRTGK